MYFGLNDNCPYSHANLGSQWVALFGEGLGAVPLSEDVTGRCLSFQSPCHFHLALCLLLACGLRCSVGVIMTAFIQCPEEGMNEFTSNYLFHFIH